MPSFSCGQSASAHGTGSDDKPMHRRFFIGPMPEKVLSQTEAQVRKKKKRIWFRHAGALPSDGEDHDNLPIIIQEHAFQFFLSQGGNEENWGDNEEESVRKEMMKRWRDSEWGSIWKRRMQQTHEPTPRWVGSSFEIGSFLGVNILDEGHAGVSSCRHSTSSKKTSSSIRPGLATGSGFSMRPNTQTQPAATTSTQDRLVSQLSQLTLLHAAPSPSIPSSPGQNLPSLPDNVETRRPSSTTPLIIPDFDQAPTNKAVSTSVRPPLVSHMVHYVEPREGDPPAPPTEVLARTGSAVQDSSAGATEAMTTREEIWGDVVMRG